MSQSRRAVLALAPALARDALDALVAEVVEGVVSQLRDQLAPANAGGWLNTKSAAEYAGCTPNAVQKAMAAGEVRFSQDGPGHKAWFKRRRIDDWRGG